VRRGRDGARRFLRGGTARWWLQRHSVEKMLECGVVRRSMVEAASSSSRNCIVSVPGKKKIGEKRIGEGEKVLLGQESWSAPGKLGWAAQGEKERKSGLRTRETNGPNSNFEFFFILLLIC
jgi:hypothetical protein